jgi:dTDP-4-dehydrorhamnose reductase
MRRFLVTGGTGQLGTALRRLVLPPDVFLVAPGRHELDLAKPESIAQTLAAGPWHGVINLAAYTTVDRAEDDGALVLQLNALAPELLAKAAAGQGIPIVHVSTDYVFSGELERPYRETDPVDPINAYGSSKEAGERSVRTVNDRHLIVRTAWLVSPYGHNFVKTMLRLATERDSIKVVADQIGTPTAALDLAGVLLSGLLRLADDAAAPSGTFHYANQGEANWAELADFIMQASAKRGGPIARIEPIATIDYPTPAKRPKNSRLDATAIENAFGLTRRPWREAVDEIVTQILAGDIS